MSGILLNLYPNEEMSDISKLPVGCTLNCSKVNILVYADYLIPTAPTAWALQILLSAFSSKLNTLSLEIKVRNSCNIVFRHSNKKSVSKLDHNQ